jgi:glucose-6-phosphate 1-dehydrogenase
LFDDSPGVTEQTNYLRFQLSSNSTIALAARVKRKGKKFIGEQKELHVIEEEPGQQSPYERLLGDAISGDPSLFTRQDAVEAAWAVVDTVLKDHPRALPYKRGSWGPKEANDLIAKDGNWHNPALEPQKV